jgi:DME family drug/metabolite transporter
MPALSSRAQGYLFALAAPICWSVGGVVMRSVEAGPWDIVFWRAFGHAVCFPFVLYFVLRVDPLRGLRDMSPVALASALLLAASFVLHVLAIVGTSVADALLLQSTSPLMVAVLARVVLKEHVSGASWIAIAVSFAGLTLVMGASFDDGGMAGKLAALAVALVSAFNVMLIRGARKVDLRPATVFAAIIACAVALAFGNPFDTSPGNAAAIFVLGIVQMTIGLTFFYTALKRLDPVSVTLIALVEPVLGPFWTWLAIGEEPTQGTLIGGAVLIGALAFNTLAGMRARPAP